MRAMSDRKTLPDRMRAAGATQTEVDEFFRLVGSCGVRPEAAMLRILADICHNTRFGAEDSVTAMVRELKRVHGVIRRLAEIYATPQAVARTREETP